MPPEDRADPLWPQSTSRPAPNALRGDLERAMEQRAGRAARLSTPSTSDTIGDERAGFERRLRAERAPVGTHYESLAGDMLRAMRRRLPLLMLFVAAGLLLGGFLFSATPQRYATSAVVQLGFSRPDGAGEAAPSAATDAGNLVESEARLMRSRMMARRVAERLDLQDRPDYTRLGFTEWLGGALSGGGAPDGVDAGLDRAAQRLQKQLVVRNDARSYLIAVEIEADSPDWAEKIANAFAYEYLSYRTSQQLQEADASARMSLRVATNAFSESHPQVIAAKRELRVAEARLRDYETAGVDGSSDWALLSGHSLVKAVASRLPTGPNVIVFLALGAVAGALAWIVTVTMLERRRSGLQSEKDVFDAVGAPCLGMIPKTGRSPSASRLLMRDQALQGVLMSAGLDGEAGGRVLLATQALPEAAPTKAIDALAETAAAEGQRVLRLNLTPASHTGPGATLDDVMRAPETLADILSRESGKVVTLRRKSGLRADDNPFLPAGEARRALGRTLEAARDAVGLVIIETPPTLLFHEAALAAGQADVALCFATWDGTPAEAATEAARRLEEQHIQLDGVVLTEVDLDLYASVAPEGGAGYLRRYQKIFDRLAKA